MRQYCGRHGCKVGRTGLHGGKPHGRRTASQLAVAYVCCISSPAARGGWPAKGPRVAACCMRQARCRGRPPACSGGAASAPPTAHRMLWCRACCLSAFPLLCTVAAGVTSAGLRRDCLASCRVARPQPVGAALLVRVWCGAGSGWLLHHAPCWVRFISQHILHASMAQCQGWMIKVSLVEV